MQEICFLIGESQPWLSNRIASKAMENWRSPGSVPELWNQNLLGETQASNLKDTNAMLCYLCAIGVGSRGFDL